MEDDPVFGVVVEAQLDRDADKPFSWPLYTWALRAKHRCPTCLLVVAPDEKIASWAAQPIEGGQPRSPFVPLVLGPGGVPVVTEPELARQAPELAVLSAMAHGGGEDALKVALAAIAAANGLDDERAKLYCDLVYVAVSAAVRRKLEELMESGSYEYQSPFAKRWLAEGKVEGKAESLLKILAARGLAVSEEQKTTIMTCSDLPTLDRWIEQVIKAESTDQALG